MEKFCQKIKNTVSGAAHLASAVSEKILVRSFLSALIGTLKFFSCRKR